MIEIDGAIEHNAMMRPTSDFFAPLAGTAFDVETVAGVISLRLEGCAEMARRGIPEGLPTPLLLIFSGPPAPVLPQDSYYVDHPAMGRQVWHLAPVMPPAPGTADSIATPPGRARYQVLFA